jgi:hypothetical protein
MTALSGLAIVVRGAHPRRVYSPQLQDHELSDSSSQRNGLICRPGEESAFHVRPWFSILFLAEVMGMKGIPIG